MKKATTQLANRVRELILNGTWIANSKLRGQLSDLTVEQAITKIDALNTIATLTFHLHYYIEGMIEHSYYHLGQIVLIKKMISGKKQD